MPQAAAYAGPRRKRRSGRFAAGGCLLLLLVLCAAVAILTSALRQGPVSISLGGSALKLGSDNFVLSNDQFQNGTTYFADLSGSGIRNILEIHVLSDTKKLEVVVYHATRSEQREDHLIDLTAP